jgi:hypothetical protein
VFSFVLLERTRYDSHVCIHGKTGKTQKEFGKLVSQLHKRLAKQMPKAMFETSVAQLETTMKQQGAKEATEIMKGFHTDVRREMIAALRCAASLRCT